MIAFAVGIAIGFLEVIHSNQLRTVNDGCTVLDHSFQVDRQSGCLIELILRGGACTAPGGVCPAGFIITDTEVSAVAGNIVAVNKALHIGNIACLGVFFLQNQILGVIAAGFFPGGNLLQHGKRVDVRAPFIATPADIQIPAVFVAELQQGCKMLISLRTGNRKIVLFKAPELLTIVEADEIGIVAEKFRIDGVFIVSVCMGNEIALIGEADHISRRVIVREMALAAAGGLNHTPDSLIRTGLDPGFCQLIAILHHAPGVGISVPINGHGDVKYHIGLDVLRNQIDDFLRIRSVPALDKYDPHGVLCVAGTAQCCCCFRSYTGRRLQERSVIRRRYGTCHCAECQNS